MKDCDFGLGGDGKVLLSSQTFTCWICGGDATVDTTYSSVPLFRCADCGFLFAPQRATAELHEIYDDSYFEEYPGGESYIADEAQRAYEADRRLRWMAGWVKGGSLLEIGAADGSFLAAAEAAGFAGVGVEPAAGLAARARDQRGLDVRAGFIETVDLPATPFDAVCAWHVIEHISTPHESIRKLRSAIADDGTLFLETPNILSLKARRTGPDWFHLDPENHVAFYTPEQLTRLLADCGFELIETSTVSGFSFLRPGRALRPREIAAQGVEVAQTRTVPRRPHPWKHELLRAVAKPA